MFSFNLALRIRFRYEKGFIWLKIVWRVRHKTVPTNTLSLLSTALIPSILPSWGSKLSPLSRIYYLQLDDLFSGGITNRAQLTDGLLYSWRVELVPTVIQVRQVKGNWFQLSRISDRLFEPLSPKVFGTKSSQENLRGFSRRCTESDVVGHLFIYHWKPDKISGMASLD